MASGPKGNPKIKIGCGKSGLAPAFRVGCCSSTVLPMNYSRETVACGDEVVGFRGTDEEIKIGGESIESLKKNPGIAVSQNFSFSNFSGKFFLCGSDCYNDALKAVSDLKGGQSL